MRSFLSMLLTAALLVNFAAPVAQAADSIACGEWTDVPDAYMASLTEVCEYGLIQGYNESTYGFGDRLSRSHIAVIGSRFVHGSEDYENYGESLDNPTTWYHTSMIPYYTDTPQPLLDNLWALKGMHYAVGSYIMRGDGNGEVETFPTTFRPYDTVNAVEAFKVIYEASRTSDVLGTAANLYEFEYTGELWYAELVDALERMEVLVNLGGDSFLVDSLDTFSGYDSDVNRENAAQFIAEMLDEGVIDSEKLRVHTGSGPAEIPEDATLLPIEGYITEAGELFGWQIREYQTAVFHIPESARTGGGANFRAYNDFDMEDELYFKVNNADIDDNSMYPSEVDDDDYRYADYFIGEALDLDQTDGEIESDLEDLFHAVYDLERITLGSDPAALGGAGEFDAVSFLVAIDKGVNVYLQQMIVVPVAIADAGTYIANNDIENITFTGPILETFEGGVGVSGDYDIEDDIQELWDAFDYIVSTIVFQ
jgi:hypothetical protein